MISVNLFFKFRRLNTRYLCMFRIYFSIERNNGRIETRTLSNNGFSSTDSSLKTCTYRRVRILNARIITTMDFEVSGKKEGKASSPRGTREDAVRILGYNSQALKGPPYLLGTVPQNPRCIFQLLISLIGLV